MLYADTHLNALSVWSLTSHASCLQLQFAVGKHEAALLTAAAVAEHSPENANGHALRLLCMAALGKVQESPPEALRACLSMLQCDGLSHRFAPVLASWLLGTCRAVPNVLTCL